MNEGDLAGYCGLYCGLCTKFQSSAPSRCTGCRVTEAHSYCSIYNCATKKKGVESCVFCEDFPDCEIFKRRKVMEWPTVRENLEMVGDKGIESWLLEQGQKRKIVEKLLDDYDEGRSMTFFCKGVSLMPVNLIEEGISKMDDKIDTGEVDSFDVKQMAKAMRSVLQEIAAEHGVSLK